MLVFYMRNTPTSICISPERCVHHAVVIYILIINAIALFPHNEMMKLRTAIISPIVLGHEIAFEQWQFLLVVVRRLFDGQK